MIQRYVPGIKDKLTVLMKQSLQLRLGQSLTMAPQLQQAIRLLQLSSPEVRVEVQQALESNIMLEIAEEGEVDVEQESEQEAEEEIADIGDETAEILVEAAEISVVDGTREGLPVDSDW